MSTAGGGKMRWKSLCFPGLSLVLLAAGCRAVQSTGPATAIIPPEAVLGLTAPVSAGAVAIDPSGEHLAAVNPDSGSVTLIDALVQASSTGAAPISREVPVGTNPRTVAFSPDGTLALVTVYGSGTVAFISVASGQ